MFWADAFLKVTLALLTTGAGVDFVNYLNARLNESRRMRQELWLRITTLEGQIAALRVEIAAMKLEHHTLLNAANAARMLCWEREMEVNGLLARLGKPPRYDHTAPEPLILEGGRVCDSETSCS